MGSDACDVRDSVQQSLEALEKAGSTVPQLARTWIEAQLLHLSSSSTENLANNGQRQDPVASTTDVLVSLLQSTSTCIIVLLEQALKTDNVVRDLKDNVLQLQGDLDMANCKSSKAVEARCAMETEMAKLTTVIQEKEDQLCMSTQVNMELETQLHQFLQQGDENIGVHLPDFDSNGTVQTQSLHEPRSTSRRTSTVQDPVMTSTEQSNEAVKKQLADSKTMIQVPHDELPAIISTLEGELVDSKDMNTDLNVQLSALKASNKELVMKLEMQAKELRQSAAELEHRLQEKCREQVQEIEHLLAEKEDTVRACEQYQQAIALHKEREEDVRDKLFAARQESQQIQKRYRALLEVSSKLMQEVRKQKEPTSILEVDQAPHQYTSVPEPVLTEAKGTQTRPPTKEESLSVTKILFGVEKLCADMDETTAQLKQSNSNLSTPYPATRQLNRRKSGSQQHLHVQQRDESTPLVQSLSASDYLSRGYPSRAVAEYGIRLIDESLSGLAHNPPHMYQAPAVKRVFPNSGIMDSGVGNSYHSQFVRPASDLASLSLDQSPRSALAKTHDKDQVDFHTDQSEPHSQRLQHKQSHHSHGYAIDQFSRNQPSQLSQQQQRHHQDVPVTSRRPSSFDTAHSKHHRDEDLADAPIRYPPGIKLAHARSH
ncbi:uncharacterized protein LOC135805739 [Sycon ciliatum]|uniref:uncharacterized protein LOC135805739 n=1 Tax=Sycon ciliatum TaxID=27933 RepID=UPI0031F60348